MNERNVQKHIEDTLIHKQFFNMSCLKMVRYLYSCERNEEALALAKRCLTHDNSKLNDDEIESFAKLPTEGSKDSSDLNDEQKKLLEIHWKNNRHHPEHFSDYHNMNEIDIIEMCVDWHARNVQFGGLPLIPYITDIQRKRFLFDDEFFEKVLGYCNVLVKEE